MKACFCGTVRNCGQYLQKVLNNIDLLGNECFEEYSVLIFYDDSKDDSLPQLLQYQQNFFALKKQVPKRFQVYIHVNHETLYPHRTWNLAKARNFCVDYVLKHFPSYEFMIMMDMDDVNSKTVFPETLKQYLHRADWDALSFNTMPVYYDTWALSIYPYCFSHNHFEGNAKQATEMRSYVNSLLGNLPKGKLLPCISAFNGFAIYRLSKIINCKYEGMLNLNKIPKEYISSHGEKVKSKLAFHNLGHIDPAKEDCEHRMFHIDMSLKNNAQIRISPEKLFLLAS